MQLNSNVQLSGQFTLRRKKVDTGKVVQEVGPFSNLITNAGLDRIGTNNNPFSRCYVGTGTVPPTVGDNNMSAFLVFTGSRAVGAQIPPSAPDWYSEMSATFTFDAGTISSNITEVGVGWSNNPLGALWSRELIVDSEGNPVAITVLPNEILEVVYTLRQYHDINDFSGSFVLNGVTYNYTGRPTSLGSASINYTNNVLGLVMSLCRTGAVELGAFTAGLTGGSAISNGSATSSSIPYVPNSLTVSLVSNFSLTAANSPTGIKGFLLQPASVQGFFYNSKQVVLDKPIPKTNLNTMTITWSYSWSRYTPPGP